MRTYQWTAIIQHGTLIRFHKIEIISAENIMVAEASLEGRLHLVNNIAQYLEDSEMLIGTIIIRLHD